MKHIVAYAAYRDADLARSASAVSLLQDTASGASALQQWSSLSFL